MVFQNMSDHQNLLALVRKGNQFFSLFDLEGEGLFNKGVAALFHGMDGIIRMAVGIGIDGHGLRFEEFDSFLEGRCNFVSAQLVRQQNRRTIDQADNLVIRMVVIGEGVATAHIAKPCHQHTDRFVLRVHLTAPDVMPRINCREKMR